MEDTVIRLLSQMKNCMQSEGELRFCISLYEIFFKIRFQERYRKNICNSTEEYDPQTKKWCEIGSIFPEMLFYCKKLCRKLSKRL